MYVKGRQTDIQTPTQWNLIGRSMTVPPPVLSPSGILPPRSSNCAVILARKNSLGVLKMLILYSIFAFIKFIASKCVTWHCVSRGVYVLPPALAQIFSSAASWKISLVCIFLNVRHQVSHPQNTTSKTEVLYTYFNLQFLDTKREDKKIHHIRMMN